MSSEKTHVQLLAEFAANTKVLAPNIAADARERILDVLGNSLAGRAESLHESDPDRAVERVEINFLDELSFIPKGFVFFCG